MVMNKRFFCVFVCIISLLLVACDKNKDYDKLYDEFNQILKDNSNIQLNY